MTYITAIGTANPAYRLPQPDIAAKLCELLPLKAAEKRLLKNIYRVSGIDFRYSVLNALGDEELAFFPNSNSQNGMTTADRMKIYKTHAIHLALSAVENCFSNIETEKTAITHVISISCTGMYAPGLEIELVQQLKLNANTQRHAVNFMGCYGVFNALKIAHAITKADPRAVVLIVSVELCSLHFQTSMNRENIISNAIFSDGAAAVLVQAQSDQLKKLLIKGFHSELSAKADQHMAWQIGNSGFDIMLSAYVPELIENGIHKLVHDLLRQYQLALPDMDYFAIHPGGVAVLQACEAALGIKPEQNQISYEILKNFGNMSSATILFVLKELFQTIQKQKKNILSCAFGPGLTLESMLLES